MNDALIKWLLEIVGAEYCRIQRLILCCGHWIFCTVTMNPLLWSHSSTLPNTHIKRCQCNNQIQSWTAGVQSTVSATGVVSTSRSGTVVSACTSLKLARLCQVYLKHEQQSKLSNSSHLTTPMQLREKIPGTSRTSVAVSALDTSSEIFEGASRRQKK